MVQESVDIRFDYAGCYHHAQHYFLLIKTNQHEKIIRPAFCDRTFFCNCGNVAGDILPGERQAQGRRDREY